MKSTLGSAEARRDIPNATLLHSIRPGVGEAGSLQLICSVGMTAEHTHMHASQSSVHAHAHESDTTMHAVGTSFADCSSDGVGAPLQIAQVARACTSL